jgi:ABC-type nitrate/sulfonate/bicarbonate transport system substrate-binding protein
VGAVRSDARRNRVVIASTDCVVRSHIIGREGIGSLSELKGKRLGISSSTAMRGFEALLLAQRMGWDPVKDIDILEDAQDVSLLTDGSVDAIITDERIYADAKREGLPVLADMREWDEPIAGNSAVVDKEWLEDSSNREAARRFLKAISEAIALYHRKPEIAMDVLEKWYGIEDQEYAKIMYDQGQWIPRKPFPCYEGFERTAELYDSNEMRQHSPTEFYDDTIMREIDATGFIDGLYK